MNQIKLILNIFLSLRIYLKGDSLILKVRGTTITFTERDLLINTDRHLGLNSTQADILKSQKQVLQSSVAPLNTYRNYSCDFVKGKALARAGRN